MTVDCCLHDGHLLRPRPGPRAVLSRVRPRDPARRRVRLSRSASGRSRSPTTSPTSPASRSRPGPKSIWRYRQLLPVPTDVHAPPEHRARPDPPDQGRPAGRRAGRAQRSGSRTTPATRRTRSRTGSSPSRWPPPASWASPCCACPSTGNLANAVAAAAARAGWDSVVLIPSSLEQAKILTTAVYGGTLLAVDGNYDDVNRLATELAAEHEDWAFVNVNVRPVLRRGLQDARLRGRRAARLAAARADRGAGRVRARS